MRKFVWLTVAALASTSLTGCVEPTTPSVSSASATSSPGESAPENDAAEAGDPEETAGTAPAEAEKVEAPAEASKDIVNTAVAAESFQTLVAAVKAAGLVETLKSEGPFTVFAPTDEAFAKLPAGTVEELLKPENKAKLTAILTYHVVPGKVMAADVVKLTSAKTVEGSEVAVAVEGEAVKINGATVTAADVTCSNGVIHIIDSVILPPEPAKEASTAPAPKDIVDTAVGADGFNTLVAAVKAAGLVETLKGDGPFTVFAPTDEAFAKLPEGTLETLLKPENKPMLTAILTYHVVPGKVMAADVVKLTSAKTAQGAEVAVAVEGEKVSIGSAGVVATDIACSNGVIHVIDAVLLPPKPEATEAEAKAPAAAAKDIVDTAVSADGFKTLVAAVKAAGLVETLKGEGPFTVFAPTDDAFAKLPEGTIAELLKPENKAKLTAVLTYHVVPGKVVAADAVKLSSAKTVQGGEIAISVDGETVKLNDSKVVATDINCSNGVIHVIDTVLLPKE